MKAFWNRIKRFISRKLMVFVEKSLNEKTDDSIYFEPDKKYVNIGSGKTYHDRWINLDYSSDWYNDLPKNFVEYDLTSNAKWPFKQGSIDAFYTSHVIEHLEETHVLRLFENVYRSLSVGGRFRITCPDASALYDACQRNDRSFFADQVLYYSKEENFKHQYNSSLEHASILDLLVDVIATQRCRLRLDPLYPLSQSELEAKFKELSKYEFLDWLTGGIKFEGSRAGEHICWWDFDKISRYLSKAGFHNIYQSAYLQSLEGAMRVPKYFDLRHPHKSVYIECQKLN